MHDNVRFKTPSGHFDGFLAADHLESALKEFVIVCGNAGAEGVYISTAEAFSKAETYPVLKEILESCSIKTSRLRNLIYRLRRDKEDRTLGDLCEEVVNSSQALQDIVTAHRMKQFNTTATK